MGNIIFQQPIKAGIVGNIVVPKAATKNPPPVGSFGMVAWQANPNTADGFLVPSSISAGSLTGFDPLNRGTAQLAYADRLGSSIAQMEDLTVGVYINSADLPGSPVGQKMMITPQIIFAQPTKVFAGASSVVEQEIDLQVPTASGADTYVVVDSLYIGPNGVRVSLGAKLFVNGSPNATYGTNLDGPTYTLNAPMGPNPFLTAVMNSAMTTGTPWTGWRHFEWRVSYTQFGSALALINQSFPGVLSLDPTQYMLAEVHINAEMKFNPGTADLGWSATNWNVFTE